VTPDRLRDCLTALRWTQRGFAEALECDDRLVRRWAAGGAEIPASVAAWIETLAKVHEGLPPPQGWKRRNPPAPEA
jgi:transcriptional regulator with XRE-family HTH domain